MWYVTANPKTGEVHEPSPKLSYESFLAVLEGSLSPTQGLMPLAPKPTRKTSDSHSCLTLARTAASQSSTMSARTDPGSHPTPPRRRGFIRLPPRTRSKVNAQIYPHPFIAREGRPILGGLLALTVILWLFDFDFLAFIAFVAFVFSLQFFRDPARELPADPRAVVSPWTGASARCRTPRIRSPANPASWSRSS